MPDWYISKHFTGAYYLWHHNHRTHITSLVPERLSYTAYELNQITHHPQPQLIIKTRGYFRIFLPNVSPIGFLPDNFDFPGYVSPHTYITYNQGFENEFETHELALRVSEKYPDLQRIMTNQNRTPINRTRQQNQPSIDELFLEGVH